ncbi:MAG: tetratricopeptide repeat protein, partial [Chloroflexi bacterium]|nr:tetratricopeptide repeat protein [Chloroflexota bacterium]
GLSLKASGKYAKAEDCFLLSLDIRARLLGAGHPSCLKTMDSLARLYDDRGDNAKAAGIRSRMREVSGRGLAELQSEG